MTTVTRLRNVADHRKVLWGLLMFEAWRRRYLPNDSWA